jgi:SAM-dependent methyltransferase
MSSPDRLMQAYYAARASEYDRVYRKPERQADLRAIEQWVPSRFVAARVLEIACGTGYWTQFIAPVALQVIALDTDGKEIQPNKPSISGLVMPVKQRASAADPPSARC